MKTETRAIHTFAVGDLFADRYRLLARAGSGGFADVWKAEDTLTGKVVALKLYTRLDEESISELAKEYTRMADISHSNLLTGSHFDKVGNIPYLVMHYCDGGSLAGKIGRMKAAELRHVLRDVASGLVYLHQEGIVHQDIKPENILYDQEHDRYMLSDFGISSKSRTRLSKSVNMANMSVSMTLAYAPPEKFSSSPSDRLPDVKGDIFSLGMTLYELATGVLPFEPPMDTGREMLLQRGQLQLDYSGIADPQLREIVKACTQYGKSERFTAEKILLILDGNEHKAKERIEETPRVKPPTVSVKVSNSSVNSSDRVPTMIILLLVEIVSLVGFVWSLTEDFGCRLYEEPTVIGYTCIFLFVFNYFVIRRLKVGFLLLLLALFVFSILCIIESFQTFYVYSSIAIPAWLIFAKTIILVDGNAAQWRDDKYSVVIKRIEIGIIAIWIAIYLLFLNKMI